MLQNLDKCFSPGRVSEGDPKRPRLLGRKRKTEKQARGWDKKATLCQLLPQLRENAAQFGKVKQGQLSPTWKQRHLGRMDFSSDDVALVLVWDPAFPVVREALLVEVVIVDCVRIRLHDLNGANNMRKMFLKSATIQIARGTSLVGIEIIPNSSSRAKIICSQSWPYHWYIKGHSYILTRINRFFSLSFFQPVFFSWLHDSLAYQSSRHLVCVLNFR